MGIDRLFLYPGIMHFPGVNPFKLGPAARYSMAPMMLRLFASLAMGVGWLFSPASFRCSVIPVSNRYHGLSAPLLAGARDNPLAGVLRLIERIEAVFLSCSFLLSLDNKSLSSSS